jgi:hypothetical protein
VRDWVAVDGLLRAAVDGQVRLAVTIEIELAQFDASFDRFFEDAGGYRSAVPEHIAREADVERDYVHALLILPPTSGGVSANRSIRPSGIGCVAWTLF